MKRRLSIFWLCLAAGCADEAAMAPEAAACITEAECGGAQLCFNGECRDPRGLSVVDIEVTPLSGAGFVSQQFVEVDTRESNQVDLTLERPLLLDGNLVRGTEPLPGWEMAFDLATPERIIPGLPSRKATLKADETGHFSTALAAGEYLITAWPVETEPVPPGRFRVNLQGNLVRDFSLPESSDLLRVAGRILKTAQGPAVPGARVQFRDPREKRAVCKAVDAATDGTFTLLLPPDQNPALVQVRAGPGPVNTHVPLLDYLGAPGPLTLVTGDFSEAVTEYVKVTAASAPLANAVVRMEGLVRNTNGFFSARATTNAQGVAALVLLPGDYALSATPPETSGFGIASRTGIPVRTGNEPVLTAEIIACPERVSWSSQVLDPDGAPVAEVVVKATRIAGEPLAVPPARTFEIKTDIEGRFSLALDDGEWRVTLTPPPATRLPREPNIPICVSRGAVALCPRPLPAAVRLRNGTTVFGVVTGRTSPGDSTTLAGATVDIYERSADGRSSFMAGSALTDERGRYEISLKKIEQP